MPKKILISGIIGWDFTENQMRAQLEESGGVPLDIEIDTPGGSVFSGISIFNLIKDYSKNKNIVNTYISGMAASMGSYIALAGDKVYAYDNSTYFIHNVQSIVIGDYRDMAKESKDIEALTNLLANAYVAKTKKTRKEIRKMMDDSSYFFGQEIKDAGFVDEIIQSASEDKDKNIIVALATGRIQECQAKLKESKKIEGDIKKAASLIDLTALMNSENELDNTKTDILPKNKTEVKKTMDLNELKNSFPEIYNEAIGLGVNQERERVTAHLKLGKQSNAIEKSIDFIEKGNLVTEQNVFADYMAEGMKNQMKSNRIEDNVGSLSTKSDDFNQDETAEYTKNLKAKRMVK